MDSELALIGGLLAVAGVVVAVLAKPIGLFNERVFRMMPAPLQRFTRAANGGARMDSTSRIAINRVAGTLVTAFGAALCAFALTRTGL